MQDTTQKIIRRLQVIEGQVRGLQSMVSSSTYCIDVITQTSAVKQALSRVEDMLLESHLGHCVVKQIKTGNAEKVTREVLQVYRLKRK